MKNSKIIENYEIYDKMLKIYKYNRFILKIILLRESFFDMEIPHEIIKNIVNTVKNYINS